MARIKEQYTVLDVGNGHPNIQILYSVHTRPTKEGYITDISKLTRRPNDDYIANPVMWFKPIDEKEAIERHNEICQNIEKYVECESAKHKRSGEV